MAEEYEKRTPVFDWERGDFVRDAQGSLVTVTEGAAMEQVALKALHTVRGAFLIYADVDNPELHHKYGSDINNIRRQPLSDEVRLSEFKRAVVEALLYDPWVIEVTDVTVSRTPIPLSEAEKQNPAAKEELPQTDAAYISFTLRTIFDNDLRLEGVELQNG